MFFVQALTASSNPQRFATGRRGTSPRRRVITSGRGRGVGWGRVWRGEPSTPGGRAPVPLPALARRQESGLDCLICSLTVLYLALTVLYGRRGTSPRRRFRRRVASGGSQRVVFGVESHLRPGDVRQFLYQLSPAGKLYRKRVPIHKHSGGEVDYTA